MRVVIDTNVLVSALLVEGSVPDQVVRLVLANRSTWLVDSRIVAEYRAVLARSELRLPSAEVERILDVVDADAVWVIASPLDLTLPDETDRPFLEVAIAGGADALITGNERHFRPRQGRLDIAVLTPRKFLDRFAGR